MCSAQWTTWVRSMTKIEMVMGVQRVQKVPDIMAQGKLQERWANEMKNKNDARQMRFVQNTDEINGFYKFNSNCNIFTMIGHEYSFIVSTFFRETKTTCIIRMCRFYLLIEFSVQK